MRPAAFVAEKIDRATDPVAATGDGELPGSRRTGASRVRREGLPVTEDRGSRIKS